MADLNALIPVITMAGMMSMILLGVAALFKSFYKKVPPGEVMIVNSMTLTPLLVRTGALVYPIIHSASNVNLNVVPIEIESDLQDIFHEQFSLKISSLSVQVVDSEESILKAQKRISLVDANERNNQLSSVLNIAVREQMNTSKSIQELKNTVNETLSQIGYELVI